MAHRNYSQLFIFTFNFKANLPFDETFDIPLSVIQKQMQFVVTVAVKKCFNGIQNLVYCFYRCSKFSTCLFAKQL